MRTRSTGVVSSIPSCVTVKNAAGEEGNGRQPHEFHFPRKDSEPYLWFLLRSKSSMQRSSRGDGIAMKGKGNSLGGRRRETIKTANCSSATFQFK